MELEVARGVTRTIARYAVFLNLGLVGLAAVIWGVKRLRNNGSEPISTETAVNVELPNWFYGMLGVCFLFLLWHGFIR